MNQRDEAALRVALRAHYADREQELQAQVDATREQYGDIVYSLSAILASQISRIRTHASEALQEQVRTLLRTCPTTHRVVWDFVDRNGDQEDCDFVTPFSEVTNPI